MMQTFWYFIIDLTIRASHQAAVPMNMYYIPESPAPIVEAPDVRVFQTKVLSLLFGDEVATMSSCGGGDLDGTDTMLFFL